MKNVIAIAVILILGNVAWCQTNPNHVRVQGHTRKDGTSVPTHMRTAPNSTNRDNFSTKPNTNPYTGQAGWITPDNKSLPTYGGSTYEPSTIYPSTTYSPNTYSNYPTNNSVNLIESSSLYPYSNSGFSKTSFYDSYPTYETKSKANLREQMSTSSAIIETLPQGASVKVVSSFFGEWWEVYYNGHKGYVHSSLLTFASSGETRTTTRTTLSGYTFDNSSFYDSYPTYETKSKANLREQMSTSSAIIETLPQGASVKVISSFFGEWWEVYYNGHKGYVHSSLLTFASSGETRTTTRTTLSGYTIDNSSFYDSYPKYETKSKANLREQMSTSSAIIETLPQGASVKVISSFFGEWWEVYANGHKGYIHSSLLNFVSTGDHRESLNPDRLLTSSYTKPSGSHIAPKVEPNKIYKTNKIISLRATPNPRSIEFKLIGMYEKVRVIEFRDNWVKIEYSNESGWVEKSAISVQ